MGQQVEIRRSERAAHRPSLFWPIALISIGVIWLLGNLGVLSGANIAVLFRLWPLILIVVGIELLIGRNSPAMSGLIAIGGVVLVVIFMLIGPSLGWAGDIEVKTASFSEPRGDAVSADVSLNLGVADTTITALSDSGDLFTADLRYVGEVEFEAEGETEKVISLSQTDDGADSFNIFSSTWFISGDELDWNIGLSPDVPLELTIHSGVGEANLDLSGLQITSLEVSSGVGEINVNLPSAGERYSAQISGGVGETHLTIPAGPDITLTISGGGGETTIDVPDGAGVRVEADGGVGGVNLPDDFQRTSGDEDNFVGESGTWETDNFAEAGQQIVITYNGGVGSLNIE
jgi:hypothetical protein